MIWATVSSWSCFCWLYRASPSLTAKNIIKLISVFTISWCLCVESSLVCSLLFFAKFLKRWEYQTTLPASCKIFMQVKKQQLEMGMEKQTGPNRERLHQICVLSPAYLTYMQSTPYEMIRWKNNKLESRLLGNPFPFLFLPSWNGDQITEVRATTVRLWKNKSGEFQLSQVPKLFESQPKTTKGSFFLWAPVKASSYLCHSVKIKPWTCGVGALYPRP